MRQARSATAFLLLAMALAGCGTTRQDRDVAGPGGTAAGVYKLGKPYQVKGRWYRPTFDPAYDQVGVASWYGADFHGLPTANGELFDKEEITAAHPTLPLPSLVRVTNLANGRSLELRVNDRGPFVGNRLIDLSQAAARRLGYEQQGVTRVRVQFLKLADARGTPPEPAVTPMLVARRPAAEPVRVAAAEPMPAIVPVPAAVPAPTAVTIRARPVQVAAIETPPATPWCSVGPQFVQVGAFAETDTVRAAMATVAPLGALRVEPAFAGGRAVARLRLGPVSDPDRARALLRQVQAMGYDGAFLAPASGSAKASC
ncbi:MAG: septal ring lytic transglycosylase RlpA family protein [Geminicoccaceae bacterium]